MSVVDVLPDVPKLTRDWLLTQTTLTSLVGTRVSTRSPATIVYPYVTLQRVSGIAPVPERLDMGVLDINVWAETEGTASRVARVCRAALHAMEGYTTADAVCTGVEDVLGLGPLPDVRPNITRLLFGVAVYAHSLP